MPQGQNLYNLVVVLPLFLFSQGDLNIWYLTNVIITMVLIKCNPQEASVVQLKFRKSLQLIPEGQLPGKGLNSYSRCRACMPFECFHKADCYGRIPQSPVDVTSMWVVPISFSQNLWKWAEVSDVVLNAMKAGCVRLLYACWVKEIKSFLLQRRQTTAGLWCFVLIIISIVWFAAAQQTVKAP